MSRTRPNGMLAGFFAVCATLPIPARGQDTLDAPEPSYARTSVSVQAGLLGLGVEVQRFLNDHVSVRAGYSGLSQALPEIEADVAAFESSVSLSGARLLVDVYPFQTRGLHLTGGYFLGQNRVHGTAPVSEGDSYTLGDNEHASEDVGPLHLEFLLHDAAPIVGFGFAGRPGRGLSFTSSWGLILHRVGIALRAPDARDPRIQEDLRREESELNDQIPIPYVPFFGFGLRWGF